MKIHKKIIMVLLLLMMIGYAVVVTTFNIIGKNLISVNQEDFNVYFSKAIVDGDDKSNEIIIDDKKTISFGIHELSEIGDEVVLEYEIVNSSTQYDAEIEFKIDLSGVEKYVKVVNSLDDFLLSAQDKKNGTLRISLIDVTTEEITFDFEYELIVDAVERNITAVEVCTDSNPSIPVISGGNDTWSSEDVEVVLSEIGTAVSGVSYYEYYISEVESAPSDTQEASGTTEGNLLVSDNGTNYIYYRTVSNSGCKSGWSNGVKVMIDKTQPTLVFNSELPSSVTRGDSYAIVSTYTTSNISGGSLVCNSDIDGVLENNNTSELVTLSSHVITCEVKTNANVSLVKDVKILITYAPYSVTNLVTNGSFENGVSEWGNKGSNISYISNQSVAKYGSKSFEISMSNTQVFARTLYSNVSGLANHKIYAKVSTNRANTTLYPGMYIIIGSTNTMWPSTASQAVKWNTSSAVNEWSDISLILDSNYDYLIVMLAQSSSSASGSIYFDGLTVVDLTATFGAGNEPDIAWCDRHISFFDGGTVIYK